MINPCCRLGAWMPPAKPMSPSLNSNFLRVVKTWKPKTENPVVSTVSIHPSMHPPRLRWATKNIREIFWKRLKRHTQVKTTFGEVHRKKTSDRHNQQVIQIQVLNCMWYIDVKIWPVFHNPELAYDQSYSLRLRASESMAIKRAKKTT